MSYNSNAYKRHGFCCDDCDTPIDGPDGALNELCRSKDADAREAFVELASREWRRLNYSEEPELTPEGGEG